jgi:hypothetical protein
LEACIFSFNIEAHANNAHVVAIAIHELFKIFIAKHGLHNKSSPKAAVKEHMHEFIRVASMILLKMKALETKDFADTPLRAMFVFLEMVVTEGEREDTVDRHELERIFPYSLVQAAYVDISLGKQTATDEVHGIEAFIAATEKEEKATNASTT